MENYALQRYEEQDDGKYTGHNAGWNLIGRVRFQRPSIPAASAAVEIDLQHGMGRRNQALPTSEAVGEGCPRAYLVPEKP